MTLLAQFAATGGGVANYIEDVFSCFLYTGTSATQTITNNIDLSTKGGMVWSKSRSAATAHTLYDTVRGATFEIQSNATSGQTTESNGLNQFNSNGYRIGPGISINNSGATYASWTFREQAKFFDVVTWTGNATNRTIAHSLGAVPGCIIVKRTDTTADWAVYHRSLANTQYLVLNTTAAAATGATWWNSTTPTSAVFSVGTDASVNASGGTYVAYIFAHDAGGFGLTSSDNVISCGSFDNTVASQVTLGWEPQWLLVKSASASSNWHIIDTMRGMSNTGQNLLTPNLTNAEIAQTQYFIPTATGFTQNPFFSSSTVIYIAIRRGPMKVPTDGTKVFAPTTYTGDGNTGRTISTVLSPTDLVIMNSRNSSSPNRIFTDRLRGSGTGENSGNMETLTSTTTVEESASSLNGYYATLDFQTSVRLLGSSSGIYNGGSTGYVLYTFQRAPSFFDEVCFQVTPNPSTVTHNLTVAPEFMIAKARNASDAWYCYHKDLGATKYVTLNTTDAAITNIGPWSDTNPTSSVFTVGGYLTSYTIVWYGFATCAGVSKVGSYTGTGTTQTINCGFTAGARWVMIKRTDSTGDWYVWDSARGIIAGNDPYLLINSTAAEVTGTDYVDTAATGFEISSTAPAAINANGGTFIFLAIA